jgi:hypothetical protein
VRIITGIVVIGFDVLVVKALLIARAAAAHAHHPPPSMVVYGAIFAVSLIVLGVLLRGSQESKKGGSRPAQRPGGYPYGGAR